MKVLLLGLFAIGVFLSVAFAKLGVGLPLRSLALIVSLLLLLVFFPRLIVGFLSRYFALLIFFVAFAVLGFTLARLQGMDIPTGFQHIIETILQPLLVVITMYVTATVVGIRPLIIIFVVICMFSGVIGILQYLAFEPSWQLREIIADIQGENARARFLLSKRDKAIGISLTPMSLAYQVISALIMCSILVHAKRLRLSYFNTIAALAFAISLSTEIRSLILGVIACILTTNLLHGRRARIYTVLGVLTVALMAPVILSLEARVTDVSDGSAMGRIVLAKYGLNLARDNPFGFGWGLDTRDHFWIYWAELMTFHNPHAVYSHALHNYFLNFYLTYGLIGLLFIALAAASNFRVSGLLMWFFGGYFVNAFFHNAGVLNGDINFWYAYCVMIYLTGHGALSNIAENRNSRCSSPIYRSYLVRPAVGQPKLSSYE